jgi:hypothetical protein
MSESENENRSYLECLGVYTARGADCKNTTQVYPITLIQIQ